MKTVKKDIAFLGPDGEEFAVIPAKVMELYMSKRRYKDRSEKTIDRAAHKLFQEVVEKAKEAIANYEFIKALTEKSSEKKRRPSD